MNKKKPTWGVVWMKPAGCVVLRSVAICITEWTEARVRGCRWIAPLLLGGESDSWKKTQIKNMMKLLWTNNSSGYHSYDGIILTDLYKCMKTHFIAQVVVPDHVVTLVVKQWFPDRVNIWTDKTYFGLTMSLPEEEESEHGEDDDEWCWGLPRKSGEGEEESALRGEEVSLWSSTETSISLARSCSQVSTSRIKQNGEKIIII